MPAHKPVIVIIAGGTASGKTTLSSRLCSKGRPGEVSTIFFDSYHCCQSKLAPSEREKVNYDHPSALEDELLVEHIDRLLASIAIEIPRYDFASHTRSNATELVNPAPVILVDGILSLYFPQLRERGDLKLYVDAPVDLRFERRLRRDVAERGRTPESVRQQWESTVHPMHQQYVEPSKKFADAIIDGAKISDDGVHQIWVRIQEIVRSRSLNR